MKHDQMKIKLVDGEMTDSIQVYKGYTLTTNKWYSVIIDAKGETLHVWV